MKHATVVAAAMVLLAAAGCQDDEHFPPGGGGGTGGGGGAGGGNRIDAGARSDGGVSDSGAAGEDLAGQLCDVLDLRDPLACDEAAPGGIDVVVLPAVATDLTDSAGRFDMGVPFQPDLRLAIGQDDPATRDAVVPAGMWDGGNMLVPSVAQTRWNDLMTIIGGNEPEGTASIAIYIIRAESGRPIANATVETAGADPAYYDLGAANDWIVGGGTSSSGAAILLAVPAPGEAAVAVSVDSRSIVQSIPVVSDHLTWARIFVP